MATTAFFLRLNTEDAQRIHQAAKIAAARRRERLNKYILDALEVLVTYDAQSDPAVRAALNNGPKS